MFCFFLWIMYGELFINVQFIATLRLINLSRSEILYMGQDQVKTFVSKLDLIICILTCD